MYVWLGVSYDTLDVTNVTNDSFLATCGAKEYLFGEVCKPAASVIKVSLYNFPKIHDISYCL